MSGEQWATTPVTTTSYAAGQQTQTPSQPTDDQPAATSDAQPDTSFSHTAVETPAPSSTEPTSPFSTQAPSSSIIPEQSSETSPSQQTTSEQAPNGPSTETAPVPTSSSIETSETSTQFTTSSTPLTSSTTSLTTSEEQTSSSTESTPSSTSTDMSTGDFDGYSFSKSSLKINAPSTIVYSPYANDGTCKDKDTISKDLKFIKAFGINKIRVYGVDCHTLDGILPAAASEGLKVNQGFYITNGANSIDQDVSNIINYGQKNGWDVFEFFTVGNEAINDGKLDVSLLISKISLVKSQLKSAGYNGPITTSEPPVLFLNHPELCTDSEIDFVGINPHAYFNANLYAHQAGDYVTKQQQQVAKACSKKAVITETGYPSKGKDNGNNSPSLINQFLAIKSILDSTNGECTILSTFNDLWKQPGPYGIEQSFGVIGMF